MANPNFQAIIDKISYEQLDAATNPNFKLKTGAYYLEDPDPTGDIGVLSYINGTNEFLKSGFAYFLENLSQTDAEYRDFVDSVTRNIRAATTYLYDFIKNPSAFEGNQVASATYIDTNTGKYPVLSFKTQKNVRVLDTGIGKDLSWSKVNIYAKVDGIDTVRVGYCLSADLIPIDGNPKELPKYSSLLPFDPEKRQKMTPKSLFDTTNFANSTIDEIVFEESTACYNIIRETDIVNFNNLIDAEIEENFRKYFSDSIKKILKSANKQELKDDKSLDNTYYLYGKINEYRINPRPRQGVQILVSVPYRNVTLADNTAKETIRDIFTSPIVLQNLADSISGKEIFDFSKYAPGISDALSGGPNVGEQFDYVQATFGGNPTLKEKVNASEIRTTIGRKVNIALKDYEKSFDTFQKVLQTVDRRLKKDLEGKEDSEVFIDLAEYTATFVSSRTSIKKLLKDNEMFPIDDSDISLLTLKFDEGVLTEIYITDKTGDYIQLTNGKEITQNQPFNDFTFASLLNNFNAIKKEDGEKVSYQEFFSSYILPEDLAKIKLGNSEDDAQNTELSCLRNHGSLLKEQLKQNTNEFLNNIVSGESIKNVKADLDKKEWQKILKDEIGNDLNTIFDIKKNRFFDPQTIDWNAIIDQFTECITDKESAEMWRTLLIAIKNKLLNGTPIACSIPVFRLPKFPVIKLPTIPNLPSITTNYYDQFANALVEAREAMIKAIIKGVMEALDFCDTPANPADIGATSPEDVADYGQNSKALNDALSDGFGYTDESLVQETKLVLDSCSEILTKQELVQLMLGISNDQVIRLVKKEIVRLSSEEEQKISILPEKVGTFKNLVAVPDTIKTKTFFARLSRTVRQDVLDSLNQKTYSTNPELLCLDNTLLDTNLKHALMDKGLDEEAALEDIRRRREEARKKIAALGATLTLLDRDAIQGQPANCTKNPDGSITPGISDKLGRPEAFDIASNNTINALYKPYDENYDEEFHNFFDRAIEVSSSYDQLTSSYEFLKTPQKNFKENLKINSNSAVGSISLSVPSYRVGKDFGNNNDLIKYTFLSDLQVVSNTINVTNDYGFVISGSDILTASITNDITSSNNFNTPYLLDVQIGKIRDANSYKSIKYTESNDVVSGSFPETSGNVVVNTHTYTVRNKSYVESFYTNHISEKYIRLIKDRFENNIFFKNVPEVNPFTGETLQNFLSSSSPIINKFKLNPLVPENKKQCGTKFDKRLINILYNLKDDINKASRKSSCIPPKIGKDGKKSEPTPVDVENRFGAVKMLMRIYAIDYNFKLFGFGFIPSLMNSSTFYNTCYTIFSNDLQKLFGKKFVNNVFTILVQKYVLDEGLELPLSADKYSSINDYRVKAFIKYFKETQIQDTNKHIQQLLKNDNLFTKNTELSLLSGDIANYRIAKNNYKNLTNFEFDNIKIINRDFIQYNLDIINPKYKQYSDLENQAIVDITNFLIPILTFRTQNPSLTPSVHGLITAEVESLIIDVLKLTNVFKNYIGGIHNTNDRKKERDLIGDFLINKIYPRFDEIIGNNKYFIDGEGNVFYTDKFGNLIFSFKYNDKQIIQNITDPLALYFANIDEFNKYSKLKADYEDQLRQATDNIDNEYIYVDIGIDSVSLKTSLIKTLEMQISEYNRHLKELISSMITIIEQNSLDNSRNTRFSIYEVIDAVAYTDIFNSDAERRPYELGLSDNAQEQDVEYSVNLRKEAEKFVNDKLRQQLVDYRLDAQNYGGRLGYDYFSSGITNQNDPGNKNEFLPEDENSGYDYSYDSAGLTAEGDYRVTIAKELATFLYEDLKSYNDITILQKNAQQLLQSEGDISFIFKRKNINPTSYDYKKDVEMKKCFELFFQYLLPLEEIYSSYMSSILLSLSSIGTINESYNLIKQNARQILSIIDLAGDYTKSPFDNGLTALASGLKAALAVPEFMIKAQAELVDPNVAVASFFSKMYGLGVVSAAAVGVDVPVKKLPLCITSPLVPFPPIPITPPGIIAVATSFKELSKETKSNIGNEDSKDSCEDN